MMNSNHPFPLCTVSLCTFISFHILELPLEERAQNVARLLRRQADEVKTEWDKLNLHSSDWQKKIDEALERLQELQEAMDELDLKLRQAEAIKGAWQPVGDLLIDSLQDNLEKLKVKLCFYSSELEEIRFDCLLYTALFSVSESKIHDYVLLTTKHRNLKFLRTGNENKVVKNKQKFKYYVTVNKKLIGHELQNSR